MNEGMKAPDNPMLAEVNADRDALEKAQRTQAEALTNLKKKRAAYVEAIAAIDAVLVKPRKKAEGETAPAPAIQSSNRSA